MKKVINLLLAVLITGSISAQWTYKTIDNGFDEPYKIAYTEINNNAFLKMERIDTVTVLYIQGGYYCDDEPKMDIVFVVNGVDKKYKWVGDKSEKNNVIYITWSLEMWPDLFADFKEASVIKIRVNETYCTSEIYNFKTGNSKAAYNFMVK